MMDALVGQHELELYRALSAAGKLPQRIVPAIRLEAEQTKDPAGSLAYARGLRREFSDVRGLRFGMVKVFLDGVIEYPAQTAALLKPYLDGNGRPTDNRGELYTSAADYGRLAAAFNRAGWQMHAHGLGDRAVRTALDGYAYAKRVTGLRDARNAVAHLQLVDPADLRRFAQLGVTACMQLQWAAKDTWTMEALLPYIGPERHRWMYPARSLEKAGARLSGGSDWPVDALQVWNQLRTAIDRQGAFGGPAVPRTGGARPGRGAADAHLGNGVAAAPGGADGHGGAGQGGGPGGAGPGRDALPGGRHQRDGGTDDPGRRAGGARRGFDVGEGGLGTGGGRRFGPAPGLVRDGARRGTAPRLQALSGAPPLPGHGPGRDCRGPGSSGARQFGLSPPRGRGGRPRS